MFFRIFFSVLLLSLVSKIVAQDNSNFAHYFMNPYSINPSFAGTDGRPSLFLTYKKQWVGIEGAPSIANLSFQSPIGKKLGLGFNVTNAERGIINTTSALISNSISIPFSDIITMRFGASVGAVSNSVDIDAIDNVPASTLDNILDQNMYLIGNAGLSVQAKHFNLGVAIPNLFSDQFAASESFSQGSVEPLENLLIFVSNRFYLSQDQRHMIEPYLLYRFSDILPAQIEASLVVHLNHTVWFGGTYKQDFGISALAGFKFNKTFGLGYAYSIANSGENEINSPSHEIQLNLLFGGRKKNRFVYSFVDSEIPRKSKRELALEKRKKELEEKRKREEELAQQLAEQHAKEEERLAKEEAERIARLEKEKQQQEANRIAEQKAEEEREAQAAAANREQQNAAQTQAQQNAQRLAEQKAQAERDRLAKLENERKAKEEQERLANEAKSKAIEPKKEPIKQTEVAKQTEPEVKQTESVVKQNEAEQPPVKPPVRPKTNENLVEKYSTTEPVIVKRGGHLLELNTGEYVIVGVYDSYEHAEKFSDDLFFKGYQSKFGYISQEGYWYVYVFQTNDNEAAKAKRDELRIKQIFSKAWVLSVQ